MNCAELRLDEYLDGELAEAERAVVEAHLASCAACRTELERSKKLEKVLRSVPAGAAPDADRFVASVRARSHVRRASLWPLALAAAAILVAVAVRLATISGPDAFRAVPEIVQEYSRKPSTALEEDLRKHGPVAIEMLESMLETSEGRTQFACATLLFKVADGPTRERVLAKYQQKKETNGTWTLSEPGTDDSDDELVPITVSLAVDGQDRWAMNVLKKLNRLNLQAQHKVVDSVVTLLHSTNVDVQRHALEIVKKLDIEFPLSAVVDLIDSPELGEEALRFLRQETKKDFGKDKQAWLKAIGK
ncbi:MAG TPA: anti-sigma factor [Planctomycetota bacterium]|jgi:Putative zinc-finger|nr:anti-sigma factor [Planctomycetota bacterium]